MGHPNERAYVTSKRIVLPVVVLGLVAWAADMGRSVAQDLYYKRLGISPLAIYPMPHDARASQMVPASAHTHLGGYSGIRGV